MPLYVHVIDHPHARVLVDTGMTELHPLAAELASQATTWGAAPSVPFRSIPASGCVRNSSSRASHALSRTTTANAYLIAGLGSACG
jgi:hypothetical protein